MPSGDIHLTQQEWLAKYGGVVGIMMGPRPGLFIQGAPYVQDALKKLNFINFGAGRRTCAGDFIAVNVMFLYVSTLFQKYSVHRDPNNPDLQTKAMAGFTTSPQPYTAIIRERY
ncbi:cytochrome P450 2K6-like [Diaphorina citri]|uniref:Cytochrome P450 2K6-like n=1 Tax=Diaphorina citri TaxID=121845 RepID=A0A3Q0IQB2_DIACI|nr:cytochrome P450 2K6-like [Diaphorina citri]